MKVWLIKIGEPLPSDPGNERLTRVGQLARGLRAAGHEVRWWTESFDHRRKTHRTDGQTVLDVDDGYRIVLIPTIGYRRNVSLRRLWDHRQFAGQFARLAREAEPPDIILSSFPTPGACLEAVKYGREKGVPVVLDVLDLWPDVFLDLVPSWTHWAAKVALRPMRRTVRAAFSGATAVCGNTDQFVDWGLRQGCLKRSRFDRAFPIGYSAQRPDQRPLDEARAFWAQRGLREGQDGVTVCFFGRIGRLFDLSTVIEAARVLAGGGRVIRFVLCGDGDKLAETRRLAEGLDNVTFPGWVQWAQIWVLMRLSSVGLAPYRDLANFRANLPAKPMEYLSAGLPVLAGIRGVLGELLLGNDCGMTYDSGDAAGLARMLQDLHDHPRRLAEMSSNAKALFQERFVAERVYSQMTEHLAQIAASGRAVRASGGGGRPSGP